MTVAELIKRLQELPHGAEVYYDLGAEYEQVTSAHEERLADDEGEGEIERVVVLS